MIILSRWPAERLPNLPAELGRRVLEIRLYRQHCAPLQLFNIYLQSSDARGAALMGASLFEELSRRRGDTMVTGDWNCTPSQPPASIARACGVFRLADEIDGSEDTPTQIQCCMYRCRCQRRLLPPPLPPLLESVNKAANKVATKSAFEDV